MSVCCIVRVRIMRVPNYVCVPYKKLQMLPFSFRDEGADSIHPLLRAMITMKHTLLKTSFIVTVCLTRLNYYLTWLVFFFFYLYINFTPFKEPKVVIKNGCY